jgi:hypothetical protein
MTTITAESKASRSPRGPFEAVPGAGVYLVLAGWLGLVSIAIAAGLFEDAGDPPFALVAAVAGPVVAFSIAYAASPRLKRLVRSLDLRLVLAAQLWRVVGAAFLFALAFDRLPADFAVPAGVGDIATGVAALAVVLSLVRGTLTRRRLYAFTALGIGDFVVAILTGLAFRPVEMDLWPLILFPTVAVPLFATLHIVSLIQARQDWDRRVARLSGKA